MPARSFVSTTTVTTSRTASLLCVLTLASSPAPDAHQHSALVARGGRLSACCGKPASAGSPSRHGSGPASPGHGTTHGRTGAHAAHEDKGTSSSSSSGIHSPVRLDLYLHHHSTLHSVLPSVTPTSGSPSSSRHSGPPVSSSSSRSSSVGSGHHAPPPSPALSDGGSSRHKGKAVLSASPSPPRPFGEGTSGVKKNH